MINTLFMLLTTVFCTMLSIFSININGGYINKVFMNIPLTLIKDSVISYEQNEKIYSYFDKDNLELTVKDYLNNSLKKVLNGYKISFFYYIYDKETNNYYFDLSDKVKNVQIHFRYKLINQFDIDKYLTFEVKDFGE